MIRQPSRCAARRFFFRVEPEPPSPGTCVGIGPTKTLAKRADHIAKSSHELGGVSMPPAMGKVGQPIIGLGQSTDIPAK